MPHPPSSKTLEHRRKYRSVANIEAAVNCLSDDAFLHVIVVRL